METINYNNFQLDIDATAQSLRILLNQCWKILPIYEGRAKNNKVVYSKEEAYTRYKKHLTFLITKLVGASKIWQENQFYVELVYILSGMQDIEADEHDRVKYLVHHCTNLINSMIEGL